MNTFSNTDRLPQEIRSDVVAYLDEMLLLHQGNILSVFLYGSATGENYVRRHSDINLCFIFKTFDFAILDRSLNAVSKGMKKKITAPLFLTGEMISSSSDVFPVEFLEMKENHVLLYGEDIMSTVNIKTENLRLFCEQQLKGKLIRIRQAYLETGSKPVRVKLLLRDSLKTLLPIFRNLIRLKGGHPPFKKDEVIKELARYYSFDPGALLSIQEKTAGSGLRNSDDVKILFRDFIDRLNELAQKVD